MKMDSWKRNTHMSYYYRATGGFLGITLLWIHPVHQNLCSTQWPRVGNNIDYRENGFVYLLRIPRTAPFVLVFCFAGNVQTRSAAGKPITMRENVFVSLLILV